MENPENAQEELKNFNLDKLYDQIMELGEHSVGVEVWRDMSTTSQQLTLNDSFAAWFQQLGILPTKRQCECEGSMTLRPKKRVGSIKTGDAHSKTVAKKLVSSPAHGFKTRSLIWLIISDSSISGDDKLTHKTKTGTQATIWHCFECKLLYIYIL